MEDLSQDALLDKHAVDIVRNLQRLRGIDGDYDNDSGSSADRVGHRRTIHNLEKHRQKKRTIGTLDVAFKKRFFNMKEGGAAPGKDPNDMLHINFNYPRFVGFIVNNIDFTSKFHHCFTVVFVAASCH